MDREKGLTLEHLPYGSLGKSWAQQERGGDPAGTPAPGPHACVLDGGVLFPDECFSTVVLEETLESPLDCKEIKTVHPKGNQS